MKTRTELRIQRTHSHPSAYPPPSSPLAPSIFFLVTYYATLPSISLGLWDGHDKRQASKAPGEEQD
ncbi:hypothetical protein N658DRAFT_192644 [Parathielavia hyrcaniae]|uniref:Uncharacterized protein n=1 Tax=Parathielavia hyrcaniae TaxID=113614 RepID=A0AAN6T4I6_9PEZI|nr:hypothetical protein N658DRAFT_192644 [Parathielavia hyrcaniae]